MPLFRCPRLPTCKCSRHTSSALIVKSSPKQTRIVRRIDTLSIQDVLAAQNASKQRKSIASTGPPLCDADFAGLKPGIALKQHFIVIREWHMSDVLSAQNFSEIEQRVMYTRDRFITNVPIARRVSARKERKGVTSGGVTISTIIRSRAQTSNQLNDCVLTSTMEVVDHEGGEDGGWGPPVRHWTFRMRRRTENNR
ncbi:uncharacterized protein LY89DRAFT_672649 [Mollisia scopiformis]|uniref:Uncharacterized protein n=1 Tax=Mollisia scopiformis TaxID=149040 RepID=A0A194WZR4_MOLSC|nr:uncharacterized protein LY89DRAFT_672649 [Mollisia scopiformis]KUJ13435.1 hypothetical protein LY89DRAFT_672649 [Mollisia scopiformis]